MQEQPDTAAGLQMIGYISFIIMRPSLEHFLEARDVLELFLPVVNLGLGEDVLDKVLFEVVLAIY